MWNEKKKTCSVCESRDFERNNYFYGKLLTVRDFFSEQCYFNEKRWLINRMILGWGVVCGLDVIPKENDHTKVIVKPGLAIDCCGRELLVCEDTVVPLSPEGSDCHKQKQQENTETKLVVCIEYYECKTEAVHLPPIACDQKEKGEFNRIRDSFKIRVIQASEIDSNLPCRTPCILDEDKLKPLQAYLCEKLKEGCPGCPDSHCLILADLSIDPKGNLVEPVNIDTCSKRRLVHGNQSLYDLFTCFHGDLPHVTAVNWKGNGMTLSWTEFESGLYDKGIKISFDRKMDATTINKNTFIVQVKMEDSDTGNFRYEQIPGEVSYTYTEGADSESIALFAFTNKWLADVYFGYSRIREGGGEFMVQLRGDFILSAEEECSPARALDGNLIGGRLPSGNGSPGGDFVSWFFVEPKPEEDKAKKKR